MQARIQPECERDKVAAEKCLDLRRRKYQDAQNHVMENFDLHSSPLIIRIISSRKIIWPVHIARIEEKN